MSNINPQGQPAYYANPALSGQIPPFGFQPQEPQQPKKGKGRLILIGASAAVIVGLIGIANAGRPIAAAVPAPAATTAPSESSPTPEPTETYEPEDTTDYTLKFGQKLEITMDDVPVTVTYSAPKRSTNMFDKDNAETKLTICNTGDEALDDVSAGSTGAWLEDNDGGTYETYGTYRTPEFPIYSDDAKKIRAGKCLTGWVGWEGAWGNKGLAIAMDVDDSTYTWSKNGR